jgi:hypothetical protein
MSASAEVIPTSPVSLTADIFQSTVASGFGRRHALS